MKKKKKERKKVVCWSKNIMVMKIFILSWYLKIISVEQSKKVPSNKASNHTSKTKFQMRQRFQ